MMSDRRLKENVKLIGTTFDGQPIYKYTFRGSPRTHIGRQPKPLRGDFDRG